MLIQVEEMLIMPLIEHLGHQNIVVETKVGQAELKVFEEENRSQRCIVTTIRKDNSQLL